MERILEDLETVVEDGDERECVYDLFSIGGNTLQDLPLLDSCTQKCWLTEDI